ncbi:Acetyl-CoA carboxylase [Rhynchospora pubera]|uniref:Acetyl-CoA carboxylase n=1 Tax=Rhynchospora pubera TaxID=906938 RepID=A0AAV8DMD9_9POAL|nr:Acetyl-CoA carboxylase [Rhynchospora pubera]
MTIEAWNLNEGIDGANNNIMPSGTNLEVDDFCQALGGTRPIHSILVANNGMAAVKFMRSVRDWALETFGNEKAILLTAMATPEDMRINAEHIRIADQFVEVPGGTNNNNYANVQKIVEIAERTRVDAVWPGWGHASENPELPEALTSKGITFLGPPAAAMSALGDKIGSSLIAQAADVPTLPWSGSHVEIQLKDCLDTSIPDEIYRQACVYTAEEAVSTCQVVGYPAMIKASWGGGGKGIRKVHNDDEVRALFKQVQGEVPGSPIFIMKVASQSRHLEVQLLCDQYGNVAALHSRDCSVQRRHQKIIEEGPITVAPPETVEQLEQAARRLVKAVGYVGAATVEYLYSMETGEYYFLELNPRLQVEHPVTEWIAQVNLPASQVSVGMGIPLWQIPEIRRFYGKEHGGAYSAWKKTSLVATQFDFDQAQSVKPTGHCVAVRITSEDPDDGFKPTGGKVQELIFKSKPSTWAYFSVKSGGGIHEFSDSQFGHVFSFGESRSSAIANMILGLKEIQIRGEICCNVDYTIDLLNASEYRDNKIHTGWLDSRIAMRVRAERPPWYLSVVGGALYKAWSTSTAIVSEYLSYLEKGQIPPKHISLVNSVVSLNVEGSKYTIDMVRGGPGSYKLRMNGSEIEAEIHTLRDGGLLMQLDGNSHVIYAQEEAAGSRLFINGRTCLLQNDHDPSKLLAETPCKLLRFLVPDGSHLEANMPYAEVEVMKMCMPLLLPASGVIHLLMSEGKPMQAGELIANLDLDDPSAVRRAEPFTGQFPKLGPPKTVSGKVHQRFAASLNAARMILAGYEHDINKVLKDLLSCLDDPELPFLQWEESRSVLATRLPKELRSELDTKYKEYELNTTYIKNREFPAKMLTGILEAHLSSTPERERATQERLIEPLLSIVNSYEGGRASHAHVIVQSLFEEYLSVEELFGDQIQSDVIERLRLQHKKDLSIVVDIVLSHQGVRTKNKLILRLMEALVYPNPAAHREQLIRFSALNHTMYTELVQKASQLLEQTKLSDLRAYISRSLSVLEMFTEEGERISTPRRKIAIEERMEDLVSAPLAVEDALISLFDHSDATLQRRVVETYISRLYQPFLVKESIRIHWVRTDELKRTEEVKSIPPQDLIALWEFTAEHIEKPKGLDSPLVEKHSQRRHGAMVVIKSLQALPAAIAAMLKESMASKEILCSQGNEGNILHVALVGINNPMNLLQDSGDEDQAQERINKLAKILMESSMRNVLSDAGMKTISCIIQRDEGRSPMRHSFLWKADKVYYEEEHLLRHLEPPLSTFLEWDKLKGYEKIKYTPSRDRQWHLYTVSDAKQPIQRMFLRTLVRQPMGTNVLSSMPSVDVELSRAQAELSFTSSSIFRSLIGALDELELYAHNAGVRSDHAHMYLCVLGEQQPFNLVPSSRSMDLPVNPDENTVSTILREMVLKVHELVGVRMHRVSVCEWEVKLWLGGDGAASGAWRVVVTNVTGHTCTVHVYREVEGGKSHERVYNSASPVHGSLHGLPLTVQYQPLSRIDLKRLAARKASTTYCYDFPLAFETALQQVWNNEPVKTDKEYLKVTELVFSDDNCTWGTPLMPAKRGPGLNNIGIVAWRMEMHTPEFPEGRQIIVVANDITFISGSFGPKEYMFFDSVTKLAIREKLPLIYLAANSGARIGMGKDVQSCFRIGWADETNPGRGFQYIYITQEDYARIGSSVIAHELKLESGETRWVLDAVVVKDEGLGDNFKGSGAIANSYSRAYKETFTLTFVTGCTVGIGAYLARLGMRCIQRIDQPIILTGFSALNKLLGREVYSSHMQLGGPKIMSTNGVTHLTVADDLEGVSAIINWLSYVPPYIGGPLPISRTLDPPERPVAYFPETSCDPRAAIAGINDGQGNWLGGIFDKGSFIETHEGWAKTVVTGRAKLGGIPVGIIAVETQTVMQVIPADPGVVDSSERVVPQAGQVWFPDSSTKTAQALMDFNREELPLFIMANWRGFSGGQRDLLEGILQAGSMIVENLSTYKQPIFVYIPKAGELRGGALVVMQCNADHTEIYADRHAKGNVLEPEGLVEIKFRQKELLECMGRLDPQIKSLKTQLLVPGGEVDAIKKKITKRAKQLMPLYTQIALKFAELHDNSTRMEAEGSIKKVVAWDVSRAFFYKRLKRRVSESSIVKWVVEAAGEEVTVKDATELVKSWAGSEIWNDDEAFFVWKNDPKNYEAYLEELEYKKVFNLFKGSKALYKVLSMQS